MNTGSVSTAVDPQIMRDLVELGLIEEYGWTPQYIASLPYKWIQKHNYMKKIKHAAQDTRRQQQKFKAEAKNNQLSPGQKTWKTTS
jgi:hypothetical protein